MRGDGSELTGPFEFDFFPVAVSPDESRIVGVRVVNGERTIAVASLVTGEASYLSTGVIMPLDPFWSPEGDVIGFRGEDGTTVLGDLFTIQSNGSGLTRLTKDDAGEYMPSWSPDGRFIAFTGEILGERPTFHTIKPDGSDLRRIYPEPCTGEPPQWSPDGSQVMCTNFRAITEAIINVNTGDVRVTDMMTGCRGWSPDGTKLLCGNFQGTYTTNADGTNQVLVIPSDGGAPWPVWLRADP